MSNFFVKLIKHPIVFNLVLAVVVSCAIVYGVLAWLDVYTQHNKAVVVPDVKGLKLEDAEEFFKSNGLRYNVIDSVYSENVSPGAIVELVPSAGSKVKEGRIVFITVNALTSQMGKIPDVEDLSFRQAYTLLKNNGFNAIKIEYVPGDFKDLVLSVEYKGRTLQTNEMIPLAASLTLKVSTGDREVLDPDSIDMAVQELDSEEENWF